MRILAFSITALLTIALIIILDSRLLLQAPIGRLLSPQHGVWQNAEPAGINYSEDLIFPQLKGKTEVYLDERLVPHVFADNDDDAFFVQGFLHAKFRLWQMEFQTHAAAGRLCEIVGEKQGTVDFLYIVDRYFRRLGMPYAAKNSLKLMEADDTTKRMCDAYTAGINAYIQSLTKSTMPLEYKLLGYQPEAWSNYKTALFLKYMSFDLAGYEADFEYTSARNAYTRAVFENMLPIQPDSLDPIIPAGTVFDPAGIVPMKPTIADSVYFSFQRDSTILPVEPQKPDKSNGSNNWAVSGKKTRSGFPILANDPHLGLNLPSLWYEIHMQTPNFNVYGASFPCAPTVSIGFNDSCAFGFTNAGRDVRDYYEIKFKDESRQEYFFNGEWKQTEFRYEKIKVKDKPDYLDTVAYTVFGPVIFDTRYGNSNNDGKSYAVRWKAHDPSNEIKMFYQLNRAKNYADYAEAIKNLHTPGQNCVFAAKNGDIALWCQGAFPAKWKRQGDFVMPGTDSSFMWQGIIPQSENPHQMNPERGFVSSANQQPTDTSYPYYLGGSFPNYRGLTINRNLTRMQDITPQDMMQLQTDNFNAFAEMAIPVLLRNTDETILTAPQKKYWDILKDWNFKNDISEKGATVFVAFWDNLEKVIWSDELALGVSKKLSPHESTLLEGLLRDSAWMFVDNINTPEKETLGADILAALDLTVTELEREEKDGRMEWAKHKDTRVNHLLKFPTFSRLHLPIGGGTHVINATKPT
ncbi:MAG: penicillin acylase family protein, partial [Gemmatimonadaceae bacterium]|nr:penicillin acylase family protein [Chitinophagaceae bacterium]